MADLKVIDDDSDDWFVNTSEFRLYHHQRGVFLEPGVHYKIKPDDWIKKQAVIEEVDDPLAKPKKPKAEPKG